MEQEHICVFHHEHKARIERMERDNNDIWKAIDKMRNWVIVGAGSTVLCLVGILVQAFFIYAQR